MSGNNNTPPNKIKNELVQLVKEYNYLWDSNADNYRNLSLKDQTWAQIAKELGYQVADCRQLWKSTRDRYVKEVRKSAETRIPSTWSSFNQLRFLGNTFRSSKRAYRPYTEVHQQSQQQQQQQQLQQSITQDGSEYTMDTVTTDAIRINCIYSNNNSIKLETSTDATAHIFDGTADGSVLEAVEQTDAEHELPSAPAATECVSNAKAMELASLIQTLIDQQKPDQADDFGRLIANKMRLLPRPKRCELEVSILRLVNNALNQCNV